MGGGSKAGIIIEFYSKMELCKLVRGTDKYGNSIAG